MARAARTPTGPVTSEVSASWALFAGIALLTLGTGLQGTIIGVRASLEGFDTVATGFVFSAYYVGFLLGSSLAPRTLTRVGHIRVFAALASSASASVLLHALFVQPATWVAIRFVVGLCAAGLFVTAESWLNDRADEDTRGRLLGVYFVVLMGGMGSGQLLLNAADPLGFELFVLASVLVSLAAVPISLTAKPAPSIPDLHPVPFRWLFHQTPLGVIGSAATGFTTGVLFTLAAVYGATIGLSQARISVFMAAIFVGAVVMQIPLGQLSDHGDRRFTIAFTAAAGAALAFLGAVLLDQPGLPHLTLMVGIGGTAVPLYSMVLAHTNDYLEPAERTGAGARLVFASGAGAVLGPLVGAVAMSTIGPEGFFWTLSVVLGTIAVYSLYRTTRRPAATRDRRTHADPVPNRATPTVAGLVGIPGIDYRAEVPVVRPHE